MRPLFRLRAGPGPILAIKRVSPRRCDRHHADKKPKGGEFTEEERACNRLLSSLRVEVEMTKSLK